MKTKKKNNWRQEFDLDNFAPSFRNVQKILNVIFSLLQTKLLSIKRILTLSNNVFYIYIY